MITKYFNEVTGLFSGKLSYIAVSLFLLLTSISSGVFLVLAMDESDKLVAIEYISGYLFGASGIEFPNPLLPELGNNLFLIFIMMISGLVSAGFPIAYAILIYKGIALGFSAGLILESFAFEGLHALLLSLIPKNLILLPCYTIAAAVSHIHAKQSNSGDDRHMKNGRNRESGSGRYFITYIGIVVLVVLACILESFIISHYRV